MASQSFNLIGQEEEQELVAYETRQSRGPKPQSRPNSRMEEMLSQLITSQAEANKSLETKMSDLVDRISSVGRPLQGSPFTGSDPTRRSLTPPGHALMASAPYPLSCTTPSSIALERSTEEVGFRPLKVIGRPIDKGSVDATQGHRLRVVEMGENLGQERIIESHSVEPEVQGIQNPVGALFPIERIGVAPGVSAGPAQLHHIHIECDFWLYIVTDVLWQKGADKTSQTKSPDKTPRTKTPAN